eukprot:3609612-Prymnesium_polylepis.1
MDAANPSRRREHNGTNHHDTTVPAVRRSGVLHKRPAAPSLGIARRATDRNQSPHIASTLPSHTVSAHSARLLLPHRRLL